MAQRNVVRPAGTGGSIARLTHLSLVKRYSAPIIGAGPRVEPQRIEPARAPQLPEHGWGDVVARGESARLRHEAQRPSRPAELGLGEAEQQVQVGIAGVTLEGAPELSWRRRRSARA